MFRIESLTLASPKGEEYVYSFKPGINYFMGKNNTGKTEFFSFIDYMLGSSVSIESVEWFRGTLNSATMRMRKETVTCDFRRTIHKDTSYFRYADEEWGQSIDLDEYKDKLAALTTSSESFLSTLRSFVNEDVSFRTFTLFSFLGENAIGNLVDFFDRGRTLKYALKLPSILNFIFNNHLEAIAALKKKLESLEFQVSGLQRAKVNSSLIVERVNVALDKLSISSRFDGNNQNTIAGELNKVRAMLTPSSTDRKKTNVSELEVIFNNISEQLKVYETALQDNRLFEVENTNRKEYLENLDDLVANRPEYKYLADGISELVAELDKSITFNRYISDNPAIEMLKKQRLEVRKRIHQLESRFQAFSVPDKTRALSVAEELLDMRIDVDQDKLDELLSQIKRLREEIRGLQNSDDGDRIGSVSADISRLYRASAESSDIVTADLARNGFSILYVKKGNILQPQISNEGTRESTSSVNYYTGSMARHTLMQLCGYLAFLRMLVADGRYPLVPILVVDHISKPFDAENRRAIGSVLAEFYKAVDKDKLQIFLFDDESPEDLNITADHFENLVSIEDGKSGFNPFFHPKDEKPL